MGSNVDAFNINTLPLLPPTARVVPSGEYETLCVKSNLFSKYLAVYSAVDTSHKKTDPGPELAREVPSGENEILVLSCPVCLVSVAMFSPVDVSRIDASLKLLKWVRIMMEVSPSGED